MLDRHTTLRVAQSSTFGAHYASTLREWRSRFDANREAVDDLGFDHRFRRMWDFFLAYCEAGFAEGYLGDAQMLLARPRGRA